MKKIIIIFIAIILLVVFSIIEIDIIFNESLYTKKGTIRYYLTIPPEIIRNFPEIKVIGSTMYHYSVGDGPKPQSYTINYSSEAKIEMVTNQIRKYLTSNAFQENYAENSRCKIMTFINLQGTGSIDCDICPQKKKQLIKVSISYYPKD